MENGRLPFAAYEMLFKLDQSGKLTWVTNVKELLYRYGFGYVFISQQVGDITHFMQAFKQRVQDCCFQDWHDSINNSAKLSTYCTFKSLLNVEKYLSSVSVRKFASALARFRCSNHDLEIERGRKLGVDITERKCHYCMSTGVAVTEDEFHFICKCPLYTELRQRYVTATVNLNQNDFVRIMRSDSHESLIGLAKFIFHAMNLRCNHVP